MILDQVTPTQMQAARLFTGATMVGLLAAPLFRRYAQRVRLAVLSIYLLGILGFLVWFLI